MRPVTRDRDLTRLGALFVARQAAEPALSRADERVWVDLDTDLVFAALDRTVCSGHYNLRGKEALPEVALGMSRCSASVEM